jgi:hypothetical protein
LDSIAIIPMEPPPLKVSPSMSKMLSAGMGASSNLILIPDNTMQRIGAFGGMLFGIFLLAQLPEESKKSAKVASSLEEALSSQSAWIPTMILAQEAADLLSTGQFKEIIVIDELLFCPGLMNREVTWHGLNWYNPIRDWYNTEGSSFDYEKLIKQNVDAVLEVAIGEYVLTKEATILGQTFMKLVDPATKKTIGRSWQVLLTQYRMNNPFARNAEEFKGRFAAFSREITTKSLKDMGLLER